MKYRITLAAAVLLLAALPTFAANHFLDVTGYASYVDTNSSGTFNSSNPNQPFDINFNGKLGYGVGVNVYFGSNVSLELAGSEVRPQSRFSPVTGNGFQGGRIKMIPLTAVLRYNFAPDGFVNPYVGAGAAYVLFDNLSDAQDFGNLNLRSIDFKDDAGLALNAGIMFSLGKSIGLVIDGKYVPLKSSATAVYAPNGATTETRVKINPVIFSGGISFRF